ncbi:MAG: DUF1735 domain-containing protein [Chitinophagaceae bacterium]|nr:DUF1735 domain-containing protein [Chitinophagaceae bacterium]
MKLRSLLLIALVPALLTSCLKSKDSLGVIADDGSISSGIFDRFYYGQTKSFALLGSPAIETLDLLDMRYSAPRKKAGKIHAVLAVDNSLVTAYNTANGTSFVALPTNAYTLPGGLEFDFDPGNQGRHTFQLTLNKNNLNLQNAYAIGFKLVSVSEGVVDQLQKDIIVTILVKNKYDGNYAIDGTFYDVSAAGAAFTAAYPLEWQLVTTGPTQCKVQDAVDFGTPTPAYLFWTGSAYSYYGSFGLVVNFDASDNVASVVNFYGQPSGNGRSANLDPSGVNKFIPGSPAVIKIKYWMDQPSVVTPHRAYFDETWTYLGPR